MSINTQDSQQRPYRLYKGSILPRSFNNRTAVIEVVIRLLSFRDQLVRRAERFLGRALFSRHIEREGNGLR